jgi:hypothetical protein
MEKYSASRIWPVAKYAAILLLFFALAVGLQRASGAYQGDCGFHPDESAHLVSAIMIHDYVTDGFPSTPIKYAEQYYVHYPKIAVGMWPPLFHLTLAAWMLIFGTPVSSALWYLAFLAALLATGVFALLQPRYGTSALVPAGIFVTLPLVQANISIVMADILVSVFGFAAVAMLARYFEFGRKRDAVLYGVAVTLASLTKANGIAFVLAAPVAILLTRRFDLLKKPGLYYAAGVFTVFGLPWQVYSLALIQQNLYQAPGLGGLPVGSVAYLGLLWDVLGPVLSVVILAGLIFDVARRQLSDLSVCSVAAVLMVVLYHSTAGIDPRYLLTAMAPLMLLLPSGIAAIALPLGNRRFGAAAVSLAVIALFAVTTNWNTQRRPLGYRSVADSIHTRAKDAAVVMVASDAYGEGAFVASMATTFEPRRNYYALRASKVMAETTWFGNAYRVLHPSTDSMHAALISIPVDVLVIDESRPFRFPHQQIIFDAVKTHPDRWELIDRIEPGVSGSTRALAIYRLHGIPPGTARQFELNMKYSRNGNLNAVD